MRVTRRIALSPCDALRLNEDIGALERIQRELKWIDPANVHPDPRKGRQMLRFVLGQIKMAERHARERMQNEFLAPQKRLKKK